MGPKILQIHTYIWVNYSDCIVFYGTVDFLELYFDVGLCFLHHIQTFSDSKSKQPASIKTKHCTLIKSTKHLSIIFASSSLLKYVRKLKTAFYLYVKFNYYFARARNLHTLIRVHIGMQNNSKLYVYMCSGMLYASVSNVSVVEGTIKSLGARYGLWNRRSKRYHFK